ncbi:MAG: hypothetical protein ACXAD7_00640 [Candidatus Kariarchaeaceae archaeon]|jgi:hypothetical protein
MATYLEHAIKDFIVSILTKGIRTLKSPKFFPYTVLLLFIVLTGTITAFFEDLTGSDVDTDVKDLLLFVEISAALAFIFVGIVLGRLNINIQILSIVSIVAALSAIFESGLLNDPARLASIIASILYLIWIVIVSFSTFALIRDLFASESFGTILFLGKPEDDGEVMFKWLCIISVFVNFTLGYLVFTKDGIPDSTEFTALIIMITAVLAVLPLLGFQRKNDTFYTILSWFYMFSTIRIFLFTFRIFSGTSGETSFWDTIFSLFIALYTIQNAAAKGVKLGEKTDQTLEEELLERTEGLGVLRFISNVLTDRGIVLVILGIVLGFHAMQVQTILGSENFVNYFNEFTFTADSDIVVLGYEVNLAASLIIYILALFFFFILPPFRRYSNPEVTRIPWLPPYADLKLVVSGIKDGEVAWKGDTMKFIIGIGKDKIAAKFGRKPKSVGDRFTESWGKMLGRSKKKEK